MHCTEQQIALGVPPWLFEVFAPLHICEGLLQDLEVEPQNIGLGSLHPELTCWCCSRQTQLRGSSLCCLHSVKWLDCVTVASYSGCKPQFKEAWLIL